jgi:hypothetical protein
MSNLVRAMVSLKRDFFAALESYSSCFSGVLEIDSEDIEPSTLQRK